MSRQGVVCGGAWCADHNNLVDRWPEQEAVATILSIERGGGGSGANMAVDLKKLGVPFPVEAIALVGDDADGLLLRRLCDELGIGTEQFHVVPGPTTAFTDVMSVHSGKRTFFHFHGTHDIVGPDHFDFGHTNARILHLGLPGVMATLDAPCGDDPSGWVTVLKQAKQMGLETNMELCSVTAERLARLARPCLPYLDFIIIDDYEAGAVAGIETVREEATDQAACAEAAKAILALGAVELAIIHFPEGCVAATRDGRLLHKPSVRVPLEDIAGTNGAGDAFAAGILFAVHEGWSLDDAVSLAHASAAASLRALTTTGSVVAWRECLALAARWGWRDT